MSFETNPVCLACDLSGAFGVKTVRVMVPCPDGRDCAMVHFGLRCPRCGTMNRTVIGYHAGQLLPSGEYAAFGKHALEKENG